MKLVQIYDELIKQVRDIDNQIEKLHSLPVDFAREGVWQEIINRYDMTRIQLNTTRRIVERAIHEQDKIRANQHNVHSD